MDEDQKKMLWAVIGAVAVTFLIAWLVFGDKSEDNSVDHGGPGRISGEVVFDALKPEKEDEGELVFSVRKYNTGGVFEPAKMLISPSFDNGGTWMIGELEEGMPYDVRSTVVINGKEIKSSQIATVTAPASDINLMITMTWQDLPEQSIKASQNKAIGGGLEISGYIPENATYSIFAAPARDNSQLESEEVDDPQFKSVISDQKADESNEWIWNGALSQVEYLIRAELYTEDGDYIGTSDIESGVVPQGDVSLELNSKASSEPTQTPISGTVTLHGSYKSDSSVVVQVRENGSGGFFDVDSFPAESNRKWVYGDAKTGINYDVRAVLMRQGEEESKSNQKYTVAPAKDITLNIDTELSLDDPEDRPEILKCESKGDGQYDATLRYPGIDDSRAYWVRIGKDKYQGDRFNEAERPDEYGGDLEIKIRIDEERYYYSDYAYSYCSDCTTLDSYSDFSSSLKFYCGEEPE